MIGLSASVCLLSVVSYLVCGIAHISGTKSNSIKLHASESSFSVYGKHHDHMNNKHKSKTSQGKVLPTSAPLLSQRETNFAWLLRNLSQEVRQLKRDINGMRRHIQKVYLWQKQIQECTGHKSESMFSLSALCVQ